MQETTTKERKKKEIFNKETNSNRHARLSACIMRGTQGREPLSVSKGFQACHSKASNKVDTRVMIHEKWFFATLHGMVPESE